MHGPVNIKPMQFLSMGLCQGTEGTNQNSHWNHHRWHATNSLERARLLCWCL